MQMQRALSLITVAGLMTTEGYTQVAATLSDEGLSEQEIEEAMLETIDRDVRTAISYLDDKIIRLSNERAAISGQPVKMVEVDWESIKAPLPLTDSSGEPMPSSIVSGLWIANSLVAPMLKLEKQLVAADGGK